ncbi:MAG: hypothetical protein IBJ18_01960 [Phycisphaerales bacterium]|nr:hypothetical protein [Phycisphaerales bacterium]
MFTIWLTRARVTRPSSAISAKSAISPLRTRSSNRIASAIRREIRGTRPVGITVGAVRSPACISREPHWPVVK